MCSVKKLKFVTAINILNSDFLMKLFLFLCFVYLNSLAADSFDRVVIWGHKLHSHTHSYIHERFYRAFRYLGYPTYWFDNNDNVDGFDFSRTLFLTEGQVDQKIPLREDGIYLLHNCQKERYWRLFQLGRCIHFQVYTDDVLAQPHLIQVEPFIYYDMEARIVYMPWASDQLPYEIEEMKKRLPAMKKKKVCYWTGTIGGGEFGNEHQLNPFIEACQKNGIQFASENPKGEGFSRKAMLKRTAKSFLAPAIVGNWQEKKGYIPCRIFINIAAGQMGVTNSRRAYELFDQKLVYNSDTLQLFHDALDRSKTWSLEDQYVLMDFVKNKHTYLNRIATLLNFWNKLNQTDQKSDFITLP